MRMKQVLGLAQYISTLLSYRALLLSKQGEALQVGRLVTAEHKNGMAGLFMAKGAE